MNGSRWFAILICFACCVSTACDKPTLTVGRPIIVGQQEGLTVDQLTLTIEQADQTLLDAGLVLGQPLSYGKLKIVPVQSRDARSDDQYITLDEGIRSETIDVFEIGATNGASSGNQVNRVVVVNRSGKPLYLMPGEIILGGDQDRVIAKECVVPANAKPTEVPVFCVEHGRWGNRTSAANTQLLAQVAENIHPESEQNEAAIESLSRKADQDQFVASPTIAGKSVRIAVQKSASQSKVWEEVAKVNAKTGARSESGSLTANYTQKATTERLEPYRKVLRESVGEVENIVGVVVVIDGIPEAVDVFGSTPLFKRLWPKLLEGYALDAATSDAPPEDAKYEASDTTRFIAQVLQQSTVEQVSLDTPRRAGTQVAASAEIADAAAAAEAEQSVEPIHVSGFRDEP